MIEYGLGEPTEAIKKDWYVDLETDTMYQKLNNEWVVFSVNGNVIE